MTAAAAESLGLDVLLSDGAIAHLRLAHPHDEGRLKDLNRKVSLRTRRMRFFSPSEHAGSWYVAQVLKEAALGCALLAETDGVVVALASFARMERDPQLADLGLLVDDEHQHRGLGALLLEHLAGLARHHGITALSADVLADDVPMLRLLQSSGFATSSRHSGDVVEVRIDLDDRRELLDAVTRREVVAERASLRPLLEPSAIAVVGSLRPHSIASEVWSALHDSGYDGVLRRVGSGKEIGDGRPVDLAVVAVPAEHVLTVAHEAAAAGVKALCVLSADFAERGAAGRQRQDALLALCRGAGMRLLGPNCLGLLSTDPQHRFNATFCDARPRSGSTALVSQSGAIGILALRHAERRGSGLSAFVSTGNKADVSGNDLLAWFSGDPRTRTVAMFLESFGNARRFARLAAAVGRTKPVVVVKAGRSTTQPATEHEHETAAATGEVAIDALLRAAGVIRAHRLSEMFDVLTLLESPVLPRGGRIALVGNSGGPGQLAAAACSAAGLTLAELSPDTRASLARGAAEGAELTNPVNLLAPVTAEWFERALLVVASDPGVDAVVSSYTPLLRGSEERYAAALAAVHRAHPDVCLVATFPGCSWAPAALPREVPFFELPEDAVRALGKVVEHVRWRARSAVTDVTESLPATGGVRASLATAADQGARWLSPTEATRVLEQVGIPCVPVTEVHDEVAAAAAASALGFPVALKAYGPSLVHKRRQGALVLGLRSEDEVLRAYRSLVRRLGQAAHGVAVQPMVTAPDGLELLVGLVHDTEVGPLVEVGAGGSATHNLDDRVVAVPARTETAALHQLTTLRCAPAFRPQPGRAALDLGAAARAVLAVGALAHSVPEVLELEIDPLIVTPTGVHALDVKVRVTPTTHHDGLAQRDLSPVPRTRSAS